MATTTYTSSPAAAAFTAKTEASAFIPEIWSDEVIAAYQKNLKMAPLVKKIAMTGKKGDRIHVPVPVRADANQKDADTAVTVIANTEDEITIDVNRHFEYSRLIEDIVEVQALNSLRQFYTEDAGYALAKKVDTDLHQVATAFRIDGANANVGSTNVLHTGLPASYVHSSCFYNNGGTTTTAFAQDTVVAADVFSDDFFRDMIQKMDDNDVPMDNRCLVIPPSVRNQILGISRYVSSDFVSGQPVASGLIGNLYGVDVYVSSNCEVIETASENGAGPEVRAGLLFHKDAIVLAEQMSVRSQTQYKQEHLSTLYTADTLYGVECYRPEAGFVLALPN
jgi:N4-gp56 family major capsid protein